MLHIDIQANADDLRINKDIYLKILKKACEQTQRDLLDLEEAFPNNDFKKIQAITHRLKGDYGNMRVNDLSTIAKEMNDTARSDENKEQLMKQFATFQAVFDEFLKLLSNLD